MCFLFSLSSIAFTLLWSVVTFYFFVYYMTESVCICVHIHISCLAITAASDTLMLDRNVFFFFSVVVVSTVIRCDLMPFKTVYNVFIFIFLPCLLPLLNRRDYANHLANTKPCKLYCLINSI